MNFRLVALLKLFEPNYNSASLIVTYEMYYRMGNFFLDLTVLSLAGLDLDFGGRHFSQ